MSAQMTQSEMPTTTESQPPPPSQPSTGQKETEAGGNTKTRNPKSMSPLLDAWYFNEINKRDSRDAQIFKNYQINPYTKKTLDYVTPKITERRKVIPKQPTQDPCAWIEPSMRLSEDDLAILESYKTVKWALDKGVNPPQKKFYEPQTELMRLGWFPKLAPPPPPKTCLYICMQNSTTQPQPCCYFYPTPPEDLQNEAYDERFRAVHQTAEFIRTESELRRFDAIMNPNGYRGKVTTTRKEPSKK